MADLMGGGLATSNGNGTSSSRPTPTRAAGPTGSPSGIRGPRMIMQERLARETRQREERERERLEREHNEEEARMLEETRRRESERGRAAAGAGVSVAGSLPAGQESASRRAAAGTAADNGARSTGPSRAATSTQVQTPQTSQRHARTTSAAQAPPPAQVSSAAVTAGPSGTQPLRGTEPSTADNRGRNSFPHAFERWETLSAHWEGLTSFWIHRLEANANEIDQDPVSQQLSRQVTDLSSAGANLFHAVVELQRLRASSERKFHRWFIETRDEMERNQEVTAMLETALEEERRSRADAIREALEQEKGSTKIQKQLSEMRKELTISKEEARRAWEELGRREQEERERTNSLQAGHPTIVGGVQVVPMTQGVSRHNSQRDPRSHTDPAEYARSSTLRPDYTQAPAVQPVITTAGGGSAYQQTPTTVHHQGSYGSEGTYSEGEYIIDAQGNFVRNSRGDKIPFLDPASEDSDAGVEEYENPASQPGAHPISTGPHMRQPQYSSAPDYTGSGYSTPWESLPQHHHPTRLSDVIEEDDERSRTSASQVSRS